MQGGSKMRRSSMLDAVLVAFLMAVLFAVLFSVVLVLPSQAAWKTQGWQHNAADLNGTSNIQDAVDNLDARLDAAGVTSETAGANTVTGANVRATTLITAPTVEGTTVVTGANVRATQAVTSYGFSAMVSTNASQVWGAEEVGATWGDPAATYTGTFKHVYIAVPVVWGRYTTGGIPFTNAMVVASNTFTIGSCQTSFTGVAYGRIK